MSCILHIETSTTVCSVAVSEDGQTIFVQEDMKGPSHAVSLGVFVDEALSFIDSHAIPLDAVAVYRSFDGQGDLLRTECAADRHTDTGGVVCSGIVIPRIAGRCLPVSDDRCPPDGGLCSGL